MGRGDGAALSELGEAALEYVGMGLAVVPLRPRSKEPATAHGLRDWTDDPASVRAIWAAHPDLNVGVVCGAPSGGLVVIDMDEHEEESGWDALRAWERAHGELPATATALTGSGGGHLWYRCGDEVRPSVNSELAVDVRGEGSYVVAPPSVHPCGRRYEWEEPPEETAIAQADASMMAFVANVRPAGHGGTAGARFELPEAVAEGGRNDALFRFGASLRSRGLDDAVIADTLAGINATRFSPPLGAEEVARVTESVLRLRPGHSEEFESKRAGGGPEYVDARPIDGGDGGDDGTAIVTPKGKVIHNRFARVLIEQDNACKLGTIDGAPAIWLNGSYAIGWDAVDRVITRRHDAVKMAEKKEIRDYVRLMAPVRQVSHPRYIAFRNGVVDVLAPREPGTLPLLMPMEPDMVIPNVIPHDYDPEASTDYVYRVLDTMSDGDSVTMSNLQEVLGMAMWRSNKEFGQCAVLLGSGSNGKSVFLDGLCAMLGEDNFASMDINMLDRQFQAQHLAGKLANIGDDISAEFLKGNTLATFKKVVTGENIYTDVKMGQGYHFRPYCTMVFSANEFPKMEDSTFGTLRRLFPIEFRHKYDRHDPDFDPDVSRKMTTEESCRALIVMGLIGLKSALEKHGFTPNAASGRISDEIRLDNDTVAQWMADNEVTKASLLGRSTSAAYAEYADYCRGAGLMPVGKSKFSRRACTENDLATNLIWVPNAGKNMRCFVERSVENCA